MSSITPTRLAPPGAGLPRLELFVARRLMANRLRSGSREAFSEQFQLERRRIRDGVSGCDGGQRGERILIRRLRGLEDSSRDWSVWMTLDHLRICNDAFNGIIHELVHGRVPEGRASTADVKPSPDVDAGVEDEYEHSCDQLLEEVAAAAELKTGKRYAHPWFGPIDAFGWYALAAMHMGIHRRQIGRIIKGLPD